MAKTSELAAAYRAACYRVFLPDGPCDLRIGEISPRLVAWMASAKVACFAVVTAENPASQLLSAAENAARQHRLCGELTGFQSFTGENIAADGDWPLEHSYFVAGVSREAACVLGRKFGQNAVLVGAAEGIPELCWIASENE